MSSSKTGFFGRLFSPQKEEPPAVKEQPPVEAPGYSFGRLGEQGEEIGERLSFLSLRFDEMLTLRHDFSAIVAPLNEFMIAHSQAQTRLAEQEALLAEHLSMATAARRELTELHTASASVESELAGLRHQIRVMQEQAELDADTLSQAKIEVGQSTARAASLERQIAIELDRNAALKESHAAKELELAKMDRQSAEAQAQAAELQDALAAATSEVNRLQILADHLQPDLSHSKQKIVELETKLHKAELELRTSDSRTHQEVKERELLQNKHAREKNDLELALAALKLQLEGVTNRHETTLKHLDQARSLYNAKIEDSQHLERSSKEAEAALAAAERRLLLAEEQTRTLAEQVTSLEQSVAEGRARSDMLSKALAAKDVQLAQLQSKAASIEGRYATLAQDHERAQLQNEAARRKLLEQLESEKAERALAQGALAIARASREKMLAQIESLKRGRAIPGAVDSRSSTDETEISETNIHPLHSTDLPGTHKTGVE